MTLRTSTTENIVAVILEYHRPDATLKCIRSLADAGIGRILVWDNSTDDGLTRTALHKAVVMDEALTKCVKIVGNNINLGFSAGVNAAIGVVSDTEPTRYVLLMNNDATINPEGVLALLDELLCEPTNALAAPQQLSSKSQSNALLYYHAFLAALTHKKYLGSFAFLSGCCLLLDLEKTGISPLDTAFFMYGEDVALSSRLRKEGFTLAIASAAKVEHVGSASSIVGSAFYEYHVARGHLLLTSRISRSWLHAFILWPPRLTSLATRSLVRAVRARSTVPIVALWRALLGAGAG